MMYKVKLQATETIARFFTFDNVNKAADFIITCASNGYTATLEPNEDNQTVSQLNEEQKIKEKNTYKYWVELIKDGVVKHDAPMEEYFITEIIGHSWKDGYHVNIEAISHEDAIQRRLQKYTKVGEKRNGRR